METNHKIIQDPIELQKFIHWLPKLEENEVYYIVLQARKKYMPELMSSDTVEVRRFTTNKERMVEKLQQLACPIGSYKTKKGQLVRNEGLVIYITTNPRDTKKATATTAKAMVDHMVKGYHDPNYRFNPVRWADREVHRAKSRSCHVHFDIDFPTDILVSGTNIKQITLAMILKDVAKVVGTKAITIVETRGGCHLLIDPKKVISEHKNWHPQVVAIFKQEHYVCDCDQSGDLMLPIPGCIQGGFVPKLFYTGV